MSAKRKNQDGEWTDMPRSHDRKKAKIQEARQIAIQVPAHVTDGMCPVVRIAIRPTVQRQPQAPCIPGCGEVCGCEPFPSSYCAFTDIRSGTNVRNHGHAGVNVEREVTMSISAKARSSNVFQEWVIQAVVAETPASPPPEGSKS